MIEYTIINQRTNEIMEAVNTMAEAIEIREQYNEMGAWQDAYGNNEYFGTYTIGTREY